MVDGALPPPGFPIRISADHSSFATPRSFSQLTTSFFGSWCQGIHPTLFLAWSSILKICFSSYSAFFDKIVLPLKYYFFLKLVCLIIFCILYSFQCAPTNPPLASHSGASSTEFFCLYAFKKAYNRSVRRTLVVVGPSGLEPPTSRLSGVRSNLLSYKPIEIFRSLWCFQLSLDNWTV